MSKTLHTVLFITSGCLAAIFIANLLVHLFFYLIDGNIGKFLSPIWLGMNGVMVFFCVMFGWTLKKEKKLSH